MGASKKLLKTLAKMKRMVTPSSPDHRDMHAVRFILYVGGYCHQMNWKLQHYSSTVHWLYESFQLLTELEFLRRCGVVQKQADGERKQTRATRKTYAVDTASNSSIKDAQGTIIKDVKGMLKLADLVKRVDNYLLISTKQRQMSLENLAALRIQTAFRAFLVSSNLLIWKFITFVTYWSFVILNLLPPAKCPGSAVLIFRLFLQYVIIIMTFYNFLCTRVGKKGVKSIERPSEAPGSSAGPHCASSSIHHPAEHASFGSSASSNPG